MANVILGTHIIILPFGPLVTVPRIRPCPNRICSIVPDPQVDSIDPQVAISDSITKLSGGSQPKGRHGGINQTAPQAMGHHGISGHGGRELHICQNLNHAAGW